MFLILPVGLFRLRRLFFIPHCAKSVGLSTELTFYVIFLASFSYAVPSNRTVTSALHFQNPGNHYALRRVLKLSVNRYRKFLRKNCVGKLEFLVCIRSKEKIPVVWACAKHCVPKFIQIFLTRDQESCQWRLPVGSSFQGALKMLSYALFCHFSLPKNDQSDSSCSSRRWWEVSC